MKELRLLEANEIGHGILIEMDAGWVNPKDELNIDLIRENKKLDYSKPFEFFAVLQKHDVPNRNGRTYPEKILKREAERYKKIIEKGLSTSELNHPESSLIDLDIRHSGISLDKKSFMNLEITLFVKDGVLFKSQEMKDAVRKIIKEIYNKNISKNKYFDFFITKKDLSV